MPHPAAFSAFDIAFNDPNVAFNEFMLADGAPTAAPTLTATAASANQGDLSWTSVQGANDYAIDRSTDAGATWTPLASNLGVLTYADTTVQPSTTYAYRVRGTNSAGPGPWSNTATATTPAVPVVVEPQPATGVPPLTPDEAFAAGHRVVSQVHIWQNGTRINENPLPVGGGRVEIDSGADHVGRVDVSIVDEDGELLPLRSRDLLSPYGHELAVYRGAIVADEARYWPLGIYRIDEATWEWDENGIDIHVEGVDRSVAVSDAKPNHIIQIKPGTNFGSAIARLIRHSLPSVVLNFASVTDTVQELLVYEDGSDLWEAAQSMAKMIGYELFFDMEGICVLRPVPGTRADAQPVATYRDGEGGTSSPSEGR